MPPIQGEPHFRRLGKYLLENILINLNTNLSAECQLIAQSWHIILQQVHQTLEKGVVLTLHVCVPGNTCIHTYIHFRHICDYGIVGIISNMA